MPAGISSRAPSGRAPWWTPRDSNPRHLRCERSALPAELGVRGALGRTRTCNLPVRSRMLCPIETTSACRPGGRGAASRLPGLNRRPPLYESGALPAELRRHARPGGRRADDGTRTRDLDVGNVARYQLRHVRMRQIEALPGLRAPRRNRTSDLSLIRRVLSPLSYPRVRSGRRRREKADDPRAPKAPRAPRGPRRGALLPIFRRAVADGRISCPMPDLNRRPPG